MEARTFGGELKISQDATIILIKKKRRSKDQTLALIHLHSHVLKTHSKYFNTCLSERWENLASPSSSMEFVLEVQTDVQYYFDCFANMYPPFVKSFESVKQGVELLKVASQIDFPGLMERISLYLSCMLWTKEDEIRIREYSASPDFPCIHVVDLIYRLGFDGENKEDCQKQLGDLIREYIRIAFEADFNKGLELPLFLQGIGCGPPSEFSNWIFAIVSEEAKGMFSRIETEWDKKNPSKASYVYKGIISCQIKKMNWILEALLMRQVAEELVQTIVHFNAIPKYLSSRGFSSFFLAERKKLAELVLVMYQEVAAGHLLLRPQERLALLMNWHVLMNTYLRKGSFEQATTNLFCTLPMKQQTKFIKLQENKAYDIMYTIPLLSLLQSNGRLG